MEDRRMPEANVTPSVRVDTRIMAGAVARAVRAMEKRNTIPILGMVQVEAIKRRLTVSATDLDVSYSTVISGSATGRTRLLLVRADADRVFKRAPTDQVELRHNKHHECVVASGDGFSASIGTVVTDDSLPLVIDGNDVQVGPSFLLEAKALRDAMEDAKHAISAEETRYYLNGVYLVPAEKARSLEVVSTDGHRMMLVPLAYRYPPKGSRAKVMKEGGVIVPRKTVALLLALAPSGDEPITVTLWRKSAQKGNATRIRFAWHSEKIDTKLIDGTYPDYKKVIPAIGASGNKYSRVTIDSVKLASALDICMSLAGAAMPHIKLEKDDKGHLTLDLAEGGKSKARSSADAIIGGDLKHAIAFNASYLADALRRFSGAAEFWTLDASSPAVLRQADLPDRCAILMPCRWSCS
jgi:DNA polymerase III subunit beta